jgi:hypothetical protein
MIRSPRECQCTMVQQKEESGGADEMMKTAAYGLLPA